MTSAATTPGPRPAGSPALAAFLRGIERRAAVLAELQCGDPDRGDRALAAAMAEFQFTAASEDPAAGQVMAAWPARFWSLLLAHPELRNHAPVRVELSATDRLASLGSGPRAALLLSLAASLEQDAAAEVMGVASGSYELAVRRALAQLSGSEDQAALASQWRRLREQVHHRIKNLPAGRQRFLAEARAEALAGGGIEAGSIAMPEPLPASGRPRWLVPALWGLLALCAIAFVATFFGDALLRRLAGPEEGEVWSGSLQAGEEPASRYGRQLEVLTHRDFELLADPDGMAEAGQLGFHSWLAAQGVSAATPGAGPGLARGDMQAAARGGAAAAGDAPAGEHVETDHEPH
ncbi:hypothetical protein LY625_05670 [Lysobacter sp. GX 14042]|uniref:hypothetical protein n=1 Tax=Lysobacter sp. GX 14042 TaxID=2907155 RepID=UPI001F2EFC54|nr:hypothetical protein [Lysobacter sp. GX 14042]MCE7032110.1 hypothetical protein [Lysobacter sp. GX 14042]